MNQEEADQDVADEVSEEADSRAIAINGRRRTEREVRASRNPLKTCR